MEFILIAVGIVVVVIITIGLIEVFSQIKEQRQIESEQADKQRKIDDKIKNYISIYLDNGDTDFLFLMVDGDYRFIDPSCPMSHQNPEWKDSFSVNQRSRLSFFSSSFNLYSFLFSKADYYYNQGDHYISFAILQFLKKSKKTYSEQLYENVKKSLLNLSNRYKKIEKKGDFVFLGSLWTKPFVWRVKEINGNIAVLEALNQFLYSENGNPDYNFIGQKNIIIYEERINPWFKDLRIKVNVSEFNNFVDNYDELHCHHLCFKERQSLDNGDEVEVLECWCGYIEEKINKKPKQTLSIGSKIMLNLQQCGSTYWKVYNIGDDYFDIILSEPFKTTLFELLSKNESKYSEDYKCLFESEKNFEYCLGMWGNKFVSKYFTDEQRQFIIKCNNRYVNVLSNSKLMILLIDEYGLSGQSHSPRKYEEEDELYLQGYPFFMNRINGIAVLTSDAKIVYHDDDYITPYYDKIFIWKKYKEKSIACYGGMLDGEEDIHIIPMIRISKDDYRKFVGQEIDFDTGKKQNAASKNK